MRARAGLATAVLTCLSLAPAAHAFEFVPQKDEFGERGYDQIAYKHGVTVYKQGDSAMISLGADGRFVGSPERVLKTLLDYEHQQGRIARVSESRVLSRSDNQILLYQRLNLPVISDRDFVLKVTWGKRGPGYWIHFYAVKNAGPPPRTGIVRVVDHVGGWELAPALGGRATQVRFQVKIDLAGWLPRWLAKSGSGKEVPELFVALDKMAQNAALRSER